MNEGNKRIVALLDAVNELKFDFINQQLKFGVLTQSEGLGYRPHKNIKKTNAKPSK